MSSSSSSSSASAPAPASCVPSHKTLFVLIDGLGDVSIPSLAHATEAPHGRTPLQAARTPTMDLLAQHGLCGLVDSVEAGQACGSDTAHLSLLGYDPQLLYRGRGAFEAQGSGLSLQTGDVAFKSNFAFMEPDASAATAETRRTGPQGVVHRRRADRNFHQWGLPLIDALNGISLPSFPDVQVAVQHATEHRVGVRLRGPGLTDLVTGTDPLVDARPLRTCAPTDAGLAEARRTSAVVNELSARIHEVLSQHPINLARAQAGLPVANIVLLRGAGAQIAVQPFRLAQGLRGRAVMVAPTAIIAGIGASIGMELVLAPGATGDYHTDLLSKARTVVSLLRARAPEDAPEQEVNFAFLHVKAVDDAGHDKDVARKVEWLERSDEMLAEILRLLAQPHAEGGEASGRKLHSVADTAWSVVVTGDHSTPVRYGDHSVEPVPFMLTAVQHLPSFARGVPPTSPMGIALSSPQGRALAEITSSSLTDHHSVRSFDEVACVRGMLGRFPGREVMPLLRRFRQQLLGQTIAAEETAASDAMHLHPPHAHALPLAPSPAQPQQLLPHLAAPSGAATSSAAPSSSSTTLSKEPLVFPLHPSCKEGVSAWFDDAQVRAELESLSPPSSTPLPAAIDVVVIGAGLTGLSTAWELARRGFDGQRVLVLERGWVGSGATGRNGGHQTPASKQEEDDIRTLFQQLRAAGISDDSLDYRQRGGMSLRKLDTTVASSSAAARPRHASLPSDLYDVEFDRPAAGAIQPMKLLLAMAGLLQKQYGVRVWQHTPVQAIERDEEEGTAAGAAQAQPRWLVRTARGSIRARAVVHATNAWVSDLLPRLRGLVTPVRNHVIQTTPIRAHLPTVAPEDPSPDLASVSTAPSPPPPSYLSRSPNFAHDASSSSCGALWDGLSFGWHEGYDYMQQRRDGRVILGGHRYLAPKMDTEQGDSAAPLLPHVLHSLCGLLPRTFAPLFDAKGPNTNVQVSHAWAGIMGFTSTCDPVIGGAPSASSDNAPTSLKGQFVAVGFSGHGMPRCHPAGRQLAAQVEAYLRTGQWQAADLSTLQPQLRTQPSEELLRTLGITSEQLTALLQQAQARTLTARL